MEKKDQKVNGGFVMLKIKGTIERIKDFWNNKWNKRHRHAFRGFKIGIYSITNCKMTRVSV